MKALLLSALLGLAGACPPGQADGGRQPQVLQVGSKTFAESHILAEMAAQLLEHAGFTVERRLGLGGTLIAYEALQAGSIDLYPEYTGTLTEAVLHSPGLSNDELAAALAQRQLQLLSPLGFNNSYALAVSRQLARQRQLERISDLAGHPDLRLGFSHEFLNRKDGWPALRHAYGLPQSASGIEHALAYRALDTATLDVTDAYTTDGELARYELHLLDDDRQFFPTYQAALLARSDLPDAAASQLARLAGTIDETTMRSLNRRIQLEQLRPAQVAADFLLQRGMVTAADVSGAGDGPTAPPGTWEPILANTLVHLKLTGTALSLACLLAIPTALLVSRYQRVARALLYITGLVQTIPSLALLALLIPLVGLGQVPAIIALFLYSLLPIVRNTLTGLFAIDPLLKQVAAGMGLTAREELRHITLPLAVPTILAGIKTAAIISIGTATLAAFVGAGGLGEPIITGLTLNDHRLILQGAIPAAVLAIAVELAFEGLERAWVPRHLLQ